MKFLSHLIVISLCLLPGCKPDEDAEPGPDLSGSISFKWSFSNPASNLTSIDAYMVISDTTGKVLEWRKLENGVQTQMPYPPGDSKLAHVTLIQTQTSTSGSRFTTVDTYTGVVGDDYFDNNSILVPLPLVTDTEYTVTVSHRLDYNIITTYVPTGLQLDYTDANDNVEFLWGLPSAGNNNLLVLLQKNDPHENRYLYSENITAGELTIGPDDFATLTEADAHVLDYPDHASKMDWSFCIINGENRDREYTIEAAQWMSTESPVIRYPNIPNLFPEYETSVVGIGKNNEMYVTNVTDDAIPTSVTTVQAAVVSSGSLTTKRISIDASGECDVVNITDNFGPSENSVSWSIYTPMSPKVRINLPLFPNDLIEKLPILDSLKDGSFKQVTFEDYNMSYDELYKARLQTETDFFAKDYRSIGYTIDNSNGGRKSVDKKSQFNEMRERLKRLGINIPATIGNQLTK